MKKGAAAWCVAALMVVLLVAEMRETAAVTCSPMELSPCLGAMTGGQSPSTQCCSKLTAQRPCLCNYIKNPTMRPYVESPNAKKVAATCGVTIPTC